MAEKIEMQLVTNIYNKKIKFSNGWLEVNACREVPKEEAKICLTRKQIALGKQKIN